MRRPMGLGKRGILRKPEHSALILPIAAFMILYTATSLRGDEAAFKLGL